MNCEKVKELLLEYTFGEVPSEQGAEIDKHLATCAACQQEQKSVVGLHDALQSQRIADPGEAFWKDLAHKTLERISEKQTSPLQWVYDLFSFPRVAFAVGSIACLFLFLYMFKSYLLPISFPKNDQAPQLVINVAEVDVYQEVLDELLPADEATYTVWDLEETELDEFFQQLALQFNINGFTEASFEEDTEDVYQLIDQLSAEELDYIYSSLDFT